ncbi:alpha/beta hydrolase [Gracilimonas sp.]|uniref:alpha/beta hydrolase n=1 Tax=Gracilimonas sp. TaxID=1974203 RepID=UPI003D0CE130
MHISKEKLDIEIISYHGWGFDSSFWKDWKSILPEGVLFKTADRGYFLDEKHPGFSGNSKHKALFLHSFGLHWCPEEQIEQATCIIIFNGFCDFHPQDEKERLESKKALKGMISEFENNPREVLKSYWKKVFHPDKKKNIPKGKLDGELLLKDLKKLHTDSFDLQSIKNGKPIISLDGGSNKILSHNRGKKFTEITEGNAVYHFIKEAGHGLPVTHYEECWSFINAMIPIFQHDGNYRRKRHQQNSP